jgi:hypothetical protein
VNELERLDELLNPLEDGILRWSLLLHFASEAAATAILHHQEQHLVRHEMVIEGNDAWVLQLIQRLHLMDKVRLTIGISVSEELNCNLAPKQLILSEIYLSKTTHTKWSHDAILRIESVADVNSREH